ncbi:transcriptional regulator [Paenibacillus sp. CAA11]|uniref:helix-turn-helix transcriptional regulator n=1 Tax=Paenibacillus sp. CAA11 TaxID=1532905 RepID=UPI000D36631A|nr:helix-turn-helix transcriptional regulator [Paenibacillus sp. CAA11]AWB44565.1 transcriptional regulator [Paenibacillus sp. CAA11]
MNDQERLMALSVFLKKQRAKITPELVGLPAGTRRRTPGLRREEVAQLAGVSTTWYTWLEQGRTIQVSASVLENIASALQLTLDERRYLFSLALETSSAIHPLEETPSRVNPSLQRIIQELKYYPAIVSDRRCHIVGWNEAASRVFLDFQQIPEEQRNMIRLLFTRQELRRLAVNWEDFVSGYLAIFRAYYGEYVGDEWYNQFLSEMKREHPAFSEIWEENRVSSGPEVTLEFRHGKAGRMLFELTSLQVHGSSDLRCSIYTPKEDSTTELKLIQLMK